MMILCNDDKKCPYYKYGKCTCKNNCDFKSIKHYEQ